MEQNELKNVPIVILGNKIDKQDACQEEELREIFGLLKKGPFGTEKIIEVNISFFINFSWTEDLLRCSCAVSQKKWAMRKVSDG